MPKIEEICAALKVLSEAKSRGELMMAPEVGERLGMTAQHAGPLLGVMYERKIAEKPEKGKNRYQITEKGEEFLANPPKETEVKKGVPPTVPPAPTPKPVHKSAAPPAAPPLGSEEETKAEKKNDLAIPSQADIFRSVAQQLSISKQKDGTPLSAHNQPCPEDGRPGQPE